jgi:hypothetical protein
VFTDTKMLFAASAISRNLYRIDRMSWHKYMGAAGCRYRITRLLEVRREVGEGARLEEANRNRSKICRSTDNNGYRTRNLGIPSVWSGLTTSFLHILRSDGSVNDW